MLTYVTSFKCISTVPRSINEVIAKLKGSPISCLHYVTCSSITLIYYNNSDDKLLVLIDTGFSSLGDFLIESYIYYLYSEFIIINQV